MRWDTHHHANYDSPVYHAYGFGGSGLTLAPGVTEYVSAQVTETLLKSHEPAEVLVLGAGYIGVFAALEIRKTLDSAHRQDIPVTLVAQAYPKGISTIEPSLKEPTQQDNYSSMIGGGWVMPVSIEPLEDRDLWCQLVQRSQTIWQRYAELSPLSMATHKTQSLVFYGGLSNHTLNPDTMEDKSGIRNVNRTCPLNLYPEHRSTNLFYSPGYSDDVLNAVDYDRVVVFDHTIQTDTVSVLHYMTQRLHNAGVQFVQTAELINNYDDLTAFFDPNKKTVTINASGHGVSAIFNGPSAEPVRGDLVLLGIPSEQLTPAMKAVSKYSFWAGGTRYAFMRYSLDGRWFEVVLGGTFIKQDHDLTPRPNTSKDLISFWLDFFHQPPKSDSDRLQKEELLRNVIERVH